MFLVLLYKAYDLNTEDLLFIGSVNRACDCSIDRRNSHAVCFTDPPPLSDLTVTDGAIIRFGDSPTLISRYASWRLMQAGVGFAALLTYLLMYVGMPETSHPGTRGIDKEFGGKFKWVWLNPFKCLWYMRSPNLLALVSELLSGSRAIVREAVGDSDSVGMTHPRRSLDPRPSFLILVRTFKWDKLVV